MNALEILLSRRWILKADDRDLYYQVKDHLSDYKNFLSEKLGYHVIVNPYLIKLEKIPAKAEPWMGISDFHETAEYVFLCLILMYLEEKEAGEQFTLSGITDYVQSQWHEDKIDWAVYRTRRLFVRVLKFCEKSGLICVVDGNEERFAKDTEADVLYDNTGASRYFMKNFTRDISGYQNVNDFEKEDWFGMDEDRGIIRRQRVYRRLLLSMGMYRDEDTEEDYSYVKNFRNVIQNDFSEILACDLQIYRSGVFLVLDPDCRTGRCFPEDKTFSDIALLCSRILVERVKSGALVCGVDEKIHMSDEEFRSVLEECKSKYQKGFLKTYRDMTMGEFYDAASGYMEELGLIRRNGGRVCIYAAMGRLIGCFPKDF